MDKETKHALSFLANAVISKGILPTADRNILNEMACGDFSGFEQEEDLDIDFDNNTYVKVKVRGQTFECYLSRIDQDLLTRHATGRGVYSTKITLVAVDPLPLIMSKSEFTEG